MLPEKWKYFGANDLSREAWSDYWARQDFANDEATREFVRQVIYDHFDHFNEHYPNFEFGDYHFCIESWTARRAYNDIRFFQNATMDDWGLQFDQFEEMDFDYMIFREMKANRTFPFPPVVIDSCRLEDEGWRVYGRPYHLIEGTHRVSYLRRMLDRALVAGDSWHSFVVLRPKP